jgi:hypothetical protein
MITLFITCISIAITIGIIYKEHTVEYCCKTDGVVYKYVCMVRLVENDKIYYVLQSTKNASFIGVTEEQLNNEFKLNK